MSKLLPELNRSHRGNGNFIVMTIIQIFIVLIGLIGSLQNNRQYLLSYAISMLVLIILDVMQTHNVAMVGNAVIDIVSIFLAFWQSEMIRTGW